MTNIKVKKLHKDAIIPKRAHASDAGFDIYALEDTVIEPGETALVKTGLAFELPPGYEMQIRPRSGITLKTKLRVQLGTIDAGYRAEVGIIVDNISQITSLKLRELFIDDKTHNSFDDISYKIRKGDKLAQLVITRLPDVEAVEVFDVGDSDRGESGFGSSGVTAE